MALDPPSINPGAPKEQLDPASMCRLITPADATALAVTPRYISIAKGTDEVANVAVVLEGDTAAVTLTLRTGIMHPLRARSINSTNTTATQVIAYW